MPHFIVTLRGTLIHEGFDAEYMRLPQAGEPFVEFKDVDHKLVRAFATDMVESVVRVEGAELDHLKRKVVSLRAQVEELTNERN